MKFSEKDLKDRGFTLIEILVVISIIAILSGLIFPTLALAKRKANISMAHSYLKQEFLVLEMYSGDNDSVYPDYQVVKSDPKMRLPCSPLDTWDKACWNRPEPMLGSFGYIVPMRSQFTRELFPSGSTMPILCDAFSADYRLAKFDGMLPNFDKCLFDLTCEVPEKLWFAFTDGSIRIQRHRRPPRDFEEASSLGPRQVFTWPSAFSDARAPSFQ